MHIFKHIFGFHDRLHRTAHAPPQLIAATAAGGAAEVPSCEVPGKPIRGKSHQGGLRLLTAKPWTHGEEQHRLRSSCGVDGKKEVNCEDEEEEEEGRDGAVRSHEKSKMTAGRRRNPANPKIYRGGGE